MFYQIICRDDMIEIKGRKQKGFYILASRKIFTTLKDALEYKEGINPSREPCIVTNCGDISKEIDAINKFDSETGERNLPRSSAEKIEDHLNGQN